MKYEIQVHLENCGQIVWTENLNDPISFLEVITRKEEHISQCEISKRIFLFKLKFVTGIILQELNETQEEIICP